MQAAQALRKPSPRRGARGASLVEFALLLPLLVLLLFGMITGGMTLSRQNSVENAVREATRFGAILPDFDESTNLNQLYKQVVGAATGDLDAGVQDRSICVALIDDDDTWDYEIYTTSDSASSSGSDVDPASTTLPTECVLSTDDISVGAGTQRVWVRAHRQSDIDAIFFKQAVDINSRSMSRYER